MCGERHQRHEDRRGRRWEGPGARWRFMVAGSHRTAAGFDAGWPAGTGTSQPCRGLARGLAGPVGDEPDVDQRLDPAVPALGSPARRRCRLGQGRRHLEVGGVAQVRGPVERETGRIGWRRTCRLLVLYWGPHRAPVEGQTRPAFGAWAAHPVPVRGLRPSGTCQFRLCVRGMRWPLPFLRPAAFPPRSPPPACRPVLFEASSVLYGRPTPPTFRSGFGSSPSRTDPGPPWRLRAAGVRVAQGNCTPAPSQNRT